MKFRLILNPAEEEMVTVCAHQPSTLTEEIEQLVRKTEGTDRIYAYGEKAEKFLFFTQIECITVLDGKTLAIDEHGTSYRLKQRLYEIEEQLPACFIRINKSTLANEGRIERFAVTFSGGVDAIFRCGYRDYVSRRCFSAIKRRYDV